MRANKNVIYTSAIIGVISGVLLFVFQNNALCMAIFASVFAGCIVGLVIPIISFYTIKKQLEIEFHSLCIGRLNAIKGIANWFNWTEKSLDYEELLQVKPSTDKELEIYNYLLAKTDDKAKQGLDLIFSYSDADTARFYSIIDDYCGLFKNQTKIKNQMFAIRDCFDKFSIYYIEPKQVLHSAITQSHAFNGRVCKRDVFEPYKKHTSIDNNAVETVTNTMQQFLDLTKIVSYTKKVQGVKK